ncbi:MAG: helix-turn-helix transcriptional regulator [Thioploca sp.]|nr:helix-turn-helix transcriptional regulator [Thioploca sp.]
MTPFHTLLKQYRKEANISLGELANKINVRGEKDQPKTKITVSTLSRWENGISTPQRNFHTRCILLHMAKILNLSLEKCNHLLEVADRNPLSEAEQMSFYLERSSAKAVLPTIQLTANLQTFIEELLNHFDNSFLAPVLLLSQFDFISIIDTLFSYAAARYPERCIHLTLPHALEDPQSYFLELGQRCNLSKPVHNASEFENQFSDKIRNALIPHYFLLISRFEKISRNKAQELGGILRSLNEQFLSSLYILICGGQKLEELKLLNGEHSLLNYAKSYHWPELTQEDVIASSDCPDLVSQEVANNLLEISGGHPSLLKICLDWYQQNPDSLGEFTQRLSKEPLIYEWFAPFINNKQLLAQWLEKPKIASYPVYLTNKLLRDLYWRGLLIKTGNEIHWRCEAIRLAGQFIMGHK